MIPNNTAIKHTINVENKYIIALRYSSVCINVNNSSERALSVLKPPQKPVIIKVLKTGLKPLFKVK